MNENIIEVKNLKKRYGMHDALKGVSFDVKRNEILGLLGPNGAGKSTTMNILTECIVADDGEIIFNTERENSIGYLPEIPPLYTDLTVDEYLEYVCGLNKLNYKNEQKNILSIKKSLGLETYGKRLIKNLSKGYKQRVGFAQALLGNPEIIVLDEPTVGLDPQQIIEIRKLIKSLSKKHTIIFSSHTLSEVNAVCDRIVIIEEGTVAAIDSVKDLSDKIQGNHVQIYISICATKVRAEALLREVEGIDTIRESKPSDGQPGFVITGNIDDMQLRKNIFAACSEAGLPIVAMHKDDLSLEDIFLKITKR